jgi:type IX secretion system substrate protein
MKKLLIITLSLILATNAFGQISYNKEFQVNTYTNYWQEFPSVASLSTGGFIICWQSSDQDGSSYGIYGQMYDQNGIKFGEEFQINSYTDDRQWFPSASKLSNGGFVICWESSEQDGAGDGIFAQIFDETGSKLGEEFQVNTYTADDQRRPSVTGLTNGKFVICWGSNGQDGSLFGIYGQMYDQNGIKIGEEFQINTYTAYDQSLPSVTGLSNGNYIVCWVSWHQDGNYFGIFGQMYDQNGIKLGEEFQINSYTDDNQSLPAVSGLSNGKFVICWESNGQDGSKKGIYGQMYDQNGIKLGEEFQINAYTADNQSLPSVTGLSNGSYIVCWQSWHQDGNYFGIFGQMYDQNGIKLGEEFQINNYTFSYQWHTSITELSNGGIVICWDSNGQDGSYGGIYGKYFLSEPINHNLIQFDLLLPQDNTIIYNNREPLFNWENATEIQINIPWEITYDLHIDENSNFTNPIVYSGIQGTNYQAYPLIPGIQYYWKVQAVNIVGDSLWSRDVFQFYIDPNTTDISEIEESLPRKFELYQNYPNPFNPSTKIIYSIPRASYVKIEIYNSLGEKTNTLVNDYKNAGEHSIEFNGEGLSSGIYFYKLSAGKYYETRKMLLLK